MGKTIRDRRGFDIKLEGAAAPQVVVLDMPETVVIKPTDFQGLYMPKMLVKEGDSVKAGTPLFYDKRHEHVLHTSPVSGEVVEIKRGEKRKLLEVKILADRKTEYELFSRHSISEIHSLSVEKCREQLLRSGVWPCLVQRPFGVIADPSVSPKSIHISGFDSHPLAPDYNILFKGQEAYFQAGIEILKKFTTGHIHLNVHADKEISPVFSHATGVELNKFAGRHPMGCVGVQIHHLDPISKGDVVWAISPQGVIQIGKLFLTGQYDSTRILALTGPVVKSPQYYQTVVGASVKRMLEGNLTQEHVRVISGNALTGERIGTDGHIGFFDHQVTVLEEGDQYEFLGWIKPAGKKKASFSRALGLFNFLTPNRAYAMDTNTHGEPRAFVQTGVFEQVTPMDILPTHLLKAILAEDIDEMEALGIYEVVEEDLALCEFVDVSKHNVQQILREGIQLVMES